MLWITNWCKELNNGTFNLDEQSFDIIKRNDLGECYLEWDQRENDYLRKDDYITTIANDGKEYYQLTENIKQRRFNLSSHIGKEFKDKMVAFRVNMPFDHYTMFDDCIIVNGTGNFDYSELYHYEIRIENEIQSKDKVVKITPNISESGYAKLVTYSHYFNNEKSETTLILQKV